MEGNDKTNVIQYQLSNGHNFFRVVDRIKLTKSEFESKDIGDLREWIYQSKKGNIASLRGMKAVQLWKTSSLKMNYR